VSHQRPALSGKGLCCSRRRRPNGLCPRGYVCAFYPNRVGGSAGWIRAGDLTRLADQHAHGLTAWVGEWRDGDNSIRLSLKAGQLVAAGQAYWPGASPELKLFPGGPNIGEMAGAARPDGAKAVFDEDGCRVELRLIGPYLAATDNDQCGGMNVSFSGVYRRK